ncbi:MAG: hypothetical protein EOP58_16580 [Sphingomonadales bacterium]|nr:MAG: hypothetical protein EOP58_16580 [Sphingomonadales bacterium]
MAVLLERHTAISAELFQAGETLYVFQSRYPASLRASRLRQSVAGRQLREKHALLPVSEGAIALDDDMLLVRALETTWEPDFFDRLVEDVATEEDHLIALVAPASKNILCPYDGGMDVFVHSMPPSALNLRFANWMPR